MSIGEEDTALMKATECGDTDLVYLTLFHIWQKVLDFGKFYILNVVRFVMYMDYGVTRVSHARILVI